MRRYIFTLYHQHGERHEFLNGALLSLVAALYFSGTAAAPSKTNYEVCQTESCKDIAQEYLMSMDTNVDPCTDFYKYSCGNFAKNHPLDAGSGRTSHFSIMANTTNHRLKEILETGWIPNEHGAVKKAKQLYRACMDEQSIENRRTKPITDFLLMNGGWPMLASLSAFQPNLKSWQSVDQFYHSLIGNSPIFSLLVVQNFKESAKNILSLSPPIPGGRASPVPIQMNVLDKFFNEPSIAKYKDHIKEVVRAMARDTRSIITESQLEKDARGIVLFETNLRTILTPPANPGAPALTTPDFSSFQKSMTIAELQTFYNSAQPKTPKGQIDWLHRIRELFAGIKTVSVDNSEKIVVAAEHYFQKLPGLLDLTPERDIVNTIHWFFVKQTLRYVNREMVDILQKYTSPPGAPLPPSPPRWRMCLAVNELKHPMSYAYVQKYFSENAKETALGMIHQIEIEMKKQITAAKWLDNEAKKAAQEKIAHMAEFIGYPDWYKDPSLMDRRYQRLSIGGFYLNNMLLVRQFALRIQLESLRKPVDKSTWIASPVDVNAFYAPTANSITFPAGILQMPFFEADNPEALNYGGIGTVIGHEISHGFDNAGSQFDKDGNVRQWWSNSTRQEYTKRTQCFVNQFNGFRVTVNNVTYGGFGSRTLGENIADSTGMRAVFEAFKTRAKQPDYKDLKLPGFEHFTKEQLFFLSYAGSVCETSRVDVFLQLALRDPHSAAPFRIIGTLANTEGFAKTFQCAKGTVMNPVNKCGIWY